MSPQTTKKTKEQTTKKNLNHNHAATFPPPGIIHQSKVSLSRGTTEETELHYLVWHLQRQQLLLHLSEPVVVCMVQGWAFIKLLQHLSTLCELMCFSKCIPCRWWKLFLWCDESWTSHECRCLGLPVWGWCTSTYTCGKRVGFPRLSWD